MKIFQLLIMKSIIDKKAKYVSPELFVCALLNYIKKLASAKIAGDGRI